MLLLMVSTAGVLFGLFLLFLLGVFVYSVLFG